jgi:hypothetical protein
VPIYRGADNVTDHIPNDCFIDFRKYSNMGEVYEDIRNMPDNDYMAYLQRIERFLNSDKAYSFTSTYMIETIIGEITKDLERA